MATAIDCQYSSVPAKAHPRLMESAQQYSARQQQVELAVATQRPSRRQSSAEEFRHLVLKITEQRFYEGPIAFRFPMFFSGIADICEWYDDATECFHIRVTVSNSRWGKLFGYTGTFHCEKIDPMPPAAILPRRVEARE